MNSETEAEIKKSIGKNIAKFRKRKGMSQKEFAEKIGIVFTNVSYIEKGKYTPRLNTLIKMSEVLDTPLYEFFIFHSHIMTSTIRTSLLKATDEDETLLRLMYRLYIAVKSDYSPHSDIN